MRIVADQVPLFERVAEEAFVARVAACVVEHDLGGARSLPREELSRRVRVAIARGRRHELTWESSLTAFAVLAFAMGPRFDEQRDFAARLAWRYPDENTRMALVSEGVPERAWDEARAGHDDRAWAN